MPLDDTYRLPSAGVKFLGRLPVLLQHTGLVKLAQSEWCVAARSTPTPAPIRVFRSRWSTYIIAKKKKATGHIAVAVLNTDDEKLLPEDTEREYCRHPGSDGGRGEPNKKTNTKNKNCRCD